MNDYRQQHIEKKNEILDCLTETENFLRENDYKNEADVLRDNAEKLRNGEFSIAVIGEYSAGKSTFLNALMGKRILPSYSNETTATVNYLRHKNLAENGQAGTVHFKDGKTEDIYSADLETIKKYVSTESSVDVVSSIEKLDLYLDSDFLKDNITLVDTPGLNGVAEGHKEVTAQQIERSSAGIFLFNSKQPGSRSNFEFLSQLKENMDSNSILFILNQIDTINQSEGETVESVVEKLKENYKKVYPDATTIPEIWPVAAYPALIARSDGEFEYRGKNGNFSEEEKKSLEELSRMKDFENRLWRFLTCGEKTVQELKAPVVQMVTQLFNIRKSLEANIKSLEGSVDSADIEAQKLELEKNIEQLSEELSKRTGSITNEIKSAENDFYNMVRAEIGNFSKRYINNIQNFESIDEIDPEHIVKKIKNTLNSIIDDAYEEYGSRIREIIALNASEITDTLNEKLSDGLNVRIDNKLNLPSVNVGLEMFEKEKKLLNQQIANLEKELETSDIDLIKQMEMQRKKDSLKETLRNKEEALNSYRTSSMMYRPEVKVEQVTNWEERGIFKKKVPVIKTIRDDSDRVEYDRERNSVISRYDADIKKIEDELSSIPEAEVHAREKAVEYKREALSAKRMELLRFERDYSEKIKANCETALKKQKREIEDYISESEKSIIKNIKSEFKNQKTSQIEIMKTIICGSVTSQIELKRKELELLENNSKKAVNERNSLIEKYSVQKEHIQELLNKALDIEGEINNIQIDFIKEQKI